MQQITILYGCVREGRQSIRAANAVHNALKKSGRAHVKFIDINDYNLPVMKNRLKDMHEPPPALVEISNALKNADGIIFITPEYNGSYSGAFKNAVDYFTSEWAKKPIGIVCASGGAKAGINASHHVQSLILSINAYPMPYKLLIGNLSEVIEMDGTIRDEMTGKNIEKFMNEFFEFVAKHK